MKNLTTLCAHQLHLSVLPGCSLQTISSRERAKEPGIFHVVSFVLHPWRSTAGTFHHGGGWKIMLPSKWVICRFHVNLPTPESFKSQGSWRWNHLSSHAKPRLYFLDHVGNQIILQCKFHAAALMLMPRSSQTLITDRGPPAFGDGIFPKQGTSSVAHFPQILAKYS